MDLKQSNENVGAKDVPEFYAAMNIDTHTALGNRRVPEKCTLAEATRAAEEAEGLRVKYMLSGYILGRVSSNVIDFLRQAGVTAEQWQAFLKHIGTPFMLTMDEQQAITEYFQTRPKVRHEFKPLPKRHVRYYGMDLAIPEQHKFVWVDRNKYVYSSDKYMVRRVNGFLNESSSPQELLCHGCVESTWDWFVFEQHEFLKYMEEGRPVSTRE